MSYEAPKAEVRDHEVREYRDSSQLAKWTVWLLFAEIAMTVIAIWSGWEERRMLNAMEAGAFGNQEAMEAAAMFSDRRQARIAQASAVLFIFCGVVTLRWIHRMCNNATVNAKAMQFTPGWAVGWYFIPIANIWKPFQAMKEIWGESARQAGPQGREPGGLLGAWWTLWLSYSLLTNVAFQIARRITSIADALTANSFAVAGDVAFVALSGVLIMVVKRVTAMQVYAHENPLDPAMANQAPGANWA